MDALERCKIDPDVSLSAWQFDSELRELLDGSLRKKLLEWGASPAYKVLVVGAFWPELVIGLAQKDMFITVVDEDPDRLSAMSAAAADAGLLTTITCTAGNYFERTFEPGAFNLAVLWDVINRYTEYKPILKKVTRELKTGGQLFLRSRVKPFVSFGAKGALNRADLMAAVEELLVVQESIPHHFTAARVAEAATTHAFARKMLSAALSLDKGSLGMSAGLAHYVAILATKEKQLGKVSFSLKP
jgi:ubiquinone/menaquinone biosynthesis C-methylase UbiE